MLARVYVKHVALPPALTPPRLPVACRLASAFRPCGQTEQWSRELLKPFAEAAAALHERHQRPFVLSRCAASSAIPSVSWVEGSGPGRKVPFTGSRADALALHRTHLSLSHEPHLGAAVACPSGSARPCSLAVDVADVAAVCALNKRQPRFCKRWLGDCRVPFPCESDDNGERERQPGRSKCHSQNKATAALASLRLNIRQDALTLSPSWWRSGVYDASPTTALNAVVLAQHWSMRECCVKLLGVANRAFDSHCLDCTATDDGGPLGGGGGRSEPVDLVTLSPLPCGILLPTAVYTSTLMGTEGKAFREAGREPEVRFWSFLEVLTADDGQSHDLSPGDLHAHVVTIACCNHTG